MSTPANHTNDPGSITNWARVDTWDAVADIKRMRDIVNRIMPPPEPLPTGIRCAPDVLETIRKHAPAPPSDLPQPLWPRFGLRVVVDDKMAPGTWKWLYDLRSGPLPAILTKENA